MTWRRALRRGEASEKIETSEKTEKTEGTERRPEAIGRTEKSEGSGGAALVADRRRRPPAHPAVRVLAMVIAFVGTVLFGVVLAQLTLEPSAASAALVHSNVRPGHSISAYLEGTSTIEAVRQLGGNVLMGVPFGVLLPVLLPPARGLLRVAVVTVALMTLVELTQGRWSPAAFSTSTTSSSTRPERSSGTCSSACGWGGPYTPAAGTGGSADAWGVSSGSCLTRKSRKIRKRRPGRPAQAGIRPRAIGPSPRRRPRRASAPERPPPAATVPPASG